MSVVVQKQPNPAYRVWRNVSPEERTEKLQAVIARVVNDESIKDIAESMGMSRSALNMALLEYAEDDWRRAQVARALTRLDRARGLREELWNNKGERTNEALTLARDEEKSAQWELERLLSRLYGTKQEVTHNHQVAADAGLVGLAGDLLRRRVIDVVPEV